MNNGNGGALMKVVHASSNLEEKIDQGFPRVGLCAHAEQLRLPGLPSQSTRLAVSSARPAS